MKSKRRCADSKGLRKRKMKENAMMYPTEDGIGCCHRMDETRNDEVEDVCEGDETKNKGEDGDEKRGIEHRCKSDEKG
ncbi:hypothetical protein L1887_00996 [Cichorium endivia]|nr:hypothetical protein L1887_00996 [Cichorium endivia]